MKGYSPAIAMGHLDLSNPPKGGSAVGPKYPKGLLVFGGGDAQLVGPTLSLQQVAKLRALVDELIAALEDAATIHNEKAELDMLPLSVSRQVVQWRDRLNALLPSAPGEVLR